MHDLQPLNAISIKDAAVPPFVEHVAESFAGRACCSVFDLYVALYVTKKVRRNYAGFAVRGF